MMIQVHEALDIILPKIQAKGVEKVSIGESLGRILGEDIMARRPHPPMDNSAMDGFAVIAADVQAATPDKPARLLVMESIGAGVTAMTRLRPGQAVRIMTGAPVPEGADAVVMQEDTERAGDHVLVKDKAELGENIRLAGEDVQEGEVVLKKGALIRPAQVGMMAVAGRSHIYVSRKPQVAILSTGDEIKDLDENPSGPNIFNSNGYMLAAQVRSAGATPVYLGIAPDSEAALLENLRAALKSDMVLTSGGVSVGDYDLVKACLKKLGQEMLFWKVAMKPGKPLAFGKIDDTPVFGLPGNPVSSFVTFEQFVRPAIQKMLGGGELCRTVTARLTKAVRKTPGRLHFMSARVAWSGGEYLATPQEEQGSGILKSVVNADGLMIFPLEASELAEGAPVQVQLLSLGTLS